MKLGAVLAALGALLAALGALLAPSWRLLGPSWRLLWLSWRLLERLKSSQKRLRRPIEVKNGKQMTFLLVLGSVWAHLEDLLDLLLATLVAHLEAVLTRNSVLGLKKESRKGLNTEFRVKR